MSQRGGEEPAAKGRKFDDACIEILEDLGYFIPIRHKRGLDTIANPLRTDLIPLFAPQGKTAFEFKSGKNISLVKMAKDLKTKINRIRRIRSQVEPELRGIKGGVIIVEGYVADAKVLDLNNKYDVAIWDMRVMLFLLALVLQFRKLQTKEKRATRNPNTIVLDNSTMAIYATRSYRQANRFHCAIFYQDLYHQLTSQKLLEIMRILVRRLNLIARHLTTTSYLTFRIFSLCGHTDDLHKTSIRQSYTGIISDFMSYDAEDADIFAFNTAPWSFLIK